MVFLVIAAHVTDAVDMRYNPQPRANQRKQQTQWFNIECDVDTREDVKQADGLGDAIPLV